MTFSAKNLKNLENARQELISKIDQVGVQWKPETIEARAHLREIEEEIVRRAKLHEVEARKKPKNAEE